MKKLLTIKEPACDTAAEFNATAYAVARFERLKLEAAKVDATLLVSENRFVLRTKTNAHYFSGLNLVEAFIEGRKSYDEDREGER